MNNVIPINRVKKKEKPKKLLGYRMSFYSEEEITLALLALNYFGFEHIRFTRLNLKGVDPTYIHKCAIKLKNSNLMSKDSNKLLDKIIQNYEEVYQDKEVNDANKIF